MIEVNGRIAGGGLVLSVDAGQRAVPADIVPVESALRPDERSARYRHNGAVVWLTGLPASGKSTLARALERRLFGKGGSPILLDGDTLRAGLNSDLGFSAPGSHREHPQARRSRDPSGPQRPYRHRRRGFAVDSRTVRPHAASPTPRSAKFMSRPRPRCARAATPRAITPRRARVPCTVLPASAGDYQPPTASELAIDTSARTVTEATDEIERMLVKSGILFEEPVDLAANI